MIDPVEFGTILREHHFDFFSGVPCSFLKNLINYSTNELNYIAATNEGEAVAIASGAFLGGKRSGVLLQNSGLTNALSPLTSLNFIFKIPLVGFVSLRGESGLGDEPQHELLGRITERLLKLCEIHPLTLGATLAEAREQFQQAERYWKENRTVFFMVRKGTFSEEKLIKGLTVETPRCKTTVSLQEKDFPRREEALSILNQIKDRHTILLAATGKTGRELFEIENSPQHFYMVGSMGCVSSVSLGLALTRPEKKIIAIDGDGALLMRMGSLGTNGYYQPPNLLHVLLDNGSHDSTGGQATVSSNMSLARVAAASGYPLAAEVHTLSEFKDAVEAWMKRGGLMFLALPIAKGSRKGLGRPTITPERVKERLIEFIH